MWLRIQKKSFSEKLFILNNDIKMILQAQVNNCAVILLKIIKVYLKRIP